MESAGSRPRRGRPPKGGEGKRASFNTRIRDSLKQQLERAAAEAGRSLSEEIEFRLEQSFLEESTVAEIENRLQEQFHRTWQAYEEYFDRRLQGIEEQASELLRYRESVQSQLKEVTKALDQQSNGLKAAVTRLSETISTVVKK